MTIHIEEAAAAQITFEITTKSEIHNYQFGPDDRGSDYALVLDYGDSDGCLVINGTPSEWLQVLKRLGHAVIPHAPGAESVALEVDESRTKLIGPNSYKLLMQLGEELTSIERLIEQAVTGYGNAGKTRSDFYESSLFGELSDRREEIRKQLVALG